MKKIYFFTFLLTQSVFSQAPDLQWQKTLGSTTVETASSIQQTNDGGYVLAGYATSNNGDVSGIHGGADFWVVKISSSGSLEWQKAFGGTGSDMGTAVQQTTDGGFIVVGYTNSADGDVTGIHGNGGSDAWVVKLSSSGLLEWQKVLGGFNNDYCHSIQLTVDGGYILVGSTFSTDGDVSGIHGTGATSDVWVVKLSGLGGIEWQKTLGGSSNDSASSIKQTNDGGYLLAGYVNSSNGDVSGHHGSTDAWVVKLSNAGILEWQKALGGTLYDVADGILETSDGGCIVSCAASSTDGDVTGNHGARDAWVVKLSGSGVLEWQKALGGTDYEHAKTIIEIAGANYIMVGYSNSTDGDVTGNHGLDDVWVVKLSHSGNLIWQRSYGGAGNDNGYSIQQTSDGGFIGVGQTSSNNDDVLGNHGSLDIWVFKLGPEVLATPNFAAQNVKLYPNPTTSILTLESSNSIIFDKITVTDLAGKKVINQIQNSNQLNVGKLANGLYILHAYSGEEKFIAKFVKK